MNLPWRGRIDHTEDSIHALFRTQYYTYYFGRVLACALAGLGMAGAALLLPMPMWAEGLLLLLGTLLFAGRGFPAALRAEDTIEARNGVLPSSECTFTAKDVILRENKAEKHLRYRDFDRLIQDKAYLYLFLNRSALVMVDRRTVGPGSDGELMEFAAKKCGKEWESCLSLLTLNLRDVLRLLRRRR